MPIPLYPMTLFSQIKMETIPGKPRTRASPDPLQKGLKRK